MYARMLFADARSSAGLLAKMAPWALVGVTMPLLVMGLIGWAATLEMPVAGVSAQSSKVLAIDGQVIATLHGEENRTIVPLSKISRNLTRAVVATEDRSFYDHPGVSFKGIVRAARANFEGKQVLQGGSTITQQYVRNAFPSIGTQRTLTRKLRESALAVWVEQGSSKTEILEKYLNLVYFGRGAYGAEAAARTYFKVPASDLTIGQAAYLAGVIRSPERYQIGASASEATKIRNQVLGDMLAAGYVTRAEATAARAEDLKAQFKPGVSIEVESPRAGFFVEYVRQLLRREFKLTDEQILSGGLQIQTTLDLRMQEAAEQAVSSTLDAPTDPEAALISMDGNGNVKAMVGSREVNNIDRARGFNFAVDALGNGGGRPAGSAFKVIALASMIDQGKSVASTFSGPSSIKIESPRCRNADGTPWEVSNFANSGFGALDVTSATLSSVNTIYAQIMEQVVTPAQFISMSERLGIQIPQYDAGCALTLGTSDVTPMEMARAYATFSQRGNRPEIIVVSKITDSSGKVLAERGNKSEKVMEQNVADTVNYVLERNVSGGTGTGARIGRPAAGKTGTTQNYENAWFAGYTPELTTVVWMGYAPLPDGTIPWMQNVRGKAVTGGSFPATIWKKFMSEAVKGSEPSKFSKPKLGGELVQAARVSSGESDGSTSTQSMTSDGGENSSLAPGGSGDSAPPPSPRFVPRAGSGDTCGVLGNRRCPPAVAQEESQSRSRPAQPNSAPRSAEDIEAEVRRSLGI